MEKVIYVNILLFYFINYRKVKMHLLLILIMSLNSQIQGSTIEEGIALYEKKEKFAMNLFQMQPISTMQYLFLSLCLTQKMIN